MENCKRCNRLEEKLKGQLDKRLTRKFLIELGFEFPQAIARTCDSCSGTHYAKGKCFGHYMKEKRQTSEVRNDLGQRLGRNGKVLCDFPKCDYSMVRRVKAVDGKWYCASHHKGEIMGDTGIEA